MYCKKCGKEEHVSQIDPDEGWCDKCIEENTIPPEKMHDALANASLFFGESATMASESAVL